MKLKDLPDGFASNPLTMSGEELSKLPSELLAQLNISNGDMADLYIVELINNAGGVLSLDHIIAGLYYITGEVHRRTVVVSRLYRLAKKGRVSSVKGRKGIYTTSQS